MNSLPEQKIQGGTVTLHVPFLGLAQWQAGLFPDAVDQTSTRLRNRSFQSGVFSMSASRDSTPSLPVVTRSTCAQEIALLSDQAGAVIIRNFMTPEQVARINSELDAPLAALDAGSRHEHALIAEFHGHQTKRLTNLVTHSKTFREEILDDDLFHELGNVLYAPECGDWWLTTAQLIEIGPGNKAQMLHRDMMQYQPFVPMNRHAPRAITNLMLALTDFTEENGATRLIPGSQDWDDFYDTGTPAMTIPALLKAGDAMLFGGKVVHGGGANVTADHYRRGLTIPMQASIITPEEAYPLIVPLELVRTLSPRVQKILGFRSQYPNGSPGLWQHNYADLADYLQL